MTSPTKFNIAIVYVFCLLISSLIGLLIFGYRGGGIGGVAFAVALAKTGVAFNVDIYESAPVFGEIGAGIGIWPRVWKTLVSLGLEEDLQSKSTSTSQGEFPKMRSSYIQVVF